LVNVDLLGVEYFIHYCINEEKTQYQENILDSPSMVLNHEGQEEHDEEKEEKEDRRKKQNPPVSSCSSWLIIFFEFDSRSKAS
jgi:hypothetical protein